MSKIAEALRNLYLRGRITDAGLQKAVQDGVITQEEYIEMVGENGDE